MNIPIGAFISIIIPVVAMYIMYMIVGRHLLKSKKYGEKLRQKITDFKNRSFSSYEEESRSRKQLRQELLLELQNLDIPKNFKKSFETWIDTI